MVNDCIRHQDVRNRFKEDLARIGVASGMNQGIAEWMSEIQGDHSVKSLEKGKQEELLDKIRGFRDCDKFVKKCQIRQNLSNVKTLSNIFFPFIFVLKLFLTYIISVSFT